jgi:uncharacterized protein
MVSAILTTDRPLVEKVSAYVQQYMAHYDGSHDYNHILRVLGLARKIAASSPDQYDPLVVTLAALLHDVGDKKYLEPGQDSTTLVRDVLLAFDVDAELAARVQTIVSTVSYSSEIKNPATVLAIIKQYPELAVVQDADRLDAIGAVGIGRTFTFGGAKGGKKTSEAVDQDLGLTASAPGPDSATASTQALQRGQGMGETIEHFTDKLERLEGMMKTEAGKRLARERTERLVTFRAWWNEELEAANRGLVLD